MKIIEYFNLKVMRLIRVSFGPFHLGKLPSGTVKPVNKQALKDAIGNKVKLNID
jgi:23S rRNA pseudouridine2605 synthase